MRRGNDNVDDDDISPSEYRTCDACGKPFVPRQQWGKWQCFRHPGQKISGSDWDGLPRWSCCGLIDVMVGQFPGRLFGSDLLGCTPCDHHCASVDGPKPEVMVLAAHTPEGRDPMRHVIRGGVTSQDTQELEQYPGMVRVVLSRILPAAYCDPVFWATLDQEKVFGRIRKRVETSRATAFPVKNYYSGRPRQIAAEDRTDAELIAAAKLEDRSVAEAIAAELDKQQIPVPLVLVSTSAAGPDEKVKNRIARVLSNKEQ